MASTRIPSGTLHIAMEAVFNRDPDGKIWSKDIYDISYWVRYLEFFETIKLVVRIEDVPSFAPKGRAFEGAHVTFVALPFYKGIDQFIKVSIRLLVMIWTESGQINRALLRLPGPIGLAMGTCLIIRRRSYAVNLVGDIDDVLANSNFTSILKLTRLPLKWFTQLICLKASAISYVTQRALQRKYPAKMGAAQFSFSDVQLSPADFRLPDQVGINLENIKVGFCGSLAQLYKGLDILIRAVLKLKNRNIYLQVYVAGDGVFRGELESLSRGLGVSDQINFLGLLTRVEISNLLELIDLFVLPSRTEGLPRALIEAMAKGLPCIGSRVGGIPELLTDNALFESNNEDSLVETIERFLNDKELMFAEAKRNYEYVNRNFRIEFLERQQTKFLNQILAMGTFRK